MVPLRNGQITTVPIADAIESQRLVDPAGQLVNAARSVGICFGDQ